MHVVGILEYELLTQFIFLAMYTFMTNIQIHPSTAVPVEELRCQLSSTRLYLIVPLYVEGNLLLLELPYILL